MQSIEQMTLVAFSKTLKEERQLRKISQRKLALETGLDRTFISLLERGLRGPSLTTAITLAEGLGIKPSELIDKVHGRINARRGNS